MLHRHLCICRITSILVSRFLLHLQGASQKAERGRDSISTRDGLTEDSLRFASIVGSLGASIGPCDFTGAIEEVEEECDLDVVNESIMSAESTPSVFSANDIYRDDIITDM